jgi:hypothetical protein
MDGIERIECITITKSDFGAFQLSSAIGKSKQLSVEDIFDFYAPTVPDSAELEAASFGPFSGMSAKYKVDGVQWHKLWLAKENCLLFATYNGTPDAWYHEAGEVDAMLRTLRWNPTDVCS